MEQKVGHAVCGRSQPALPSGALWLGCQQASGLHNCNPCWPVIGVMAKPSYLATHFAGRINGSFASGATSGTVQEHISFAFGFGRVY